MNVRIEQVVELVQRNVECRSELRKVLEALGTETIVVTQELPIGINILLAGMCEPPLVSTPLGGDLKVSDLLEVLRHQEQLDSAMMQALDGFGRSTELSLPGADPRIWRLASDSP
jgi:hypothetical protein